MTEFVTPSNEKSQRGWLRIALITTAVMFVGAVLTFWLLFGGTKALVDGERLDEGRVTVVVDGFSAAYLVELPDGLALVDAGVDPQAEAIRAALTDRGNSPRDVKAIFLTHGHEDHIGGSTFFPEALVYALAGEVGLIEGVRVPDNLFGRFSSPSPTGIEVDVELQDGDVVNVAGADIETFALPGHTRASAAYLIQGVLFMGDSAGADDDGEMHEAPPIFSRDRNKNRESLHRLAERLSGRENSIESMVFGHQGPLDGIAPLMNWHRRN